jgi:chemosensory pili system protein ChpA (sensor histidine kinase/response regulator)
MVVDDSVAILRVLALGLERAGYEVLTACDGVDALLKIRDGQPDFLITDIEMPRMTGQELCQAIEKDYPDRTFPIVVMTTSTEPSHRQWAANIRHADFIEKPVSIRLLVAHVNRCLDEPHTAAAPI